MSPALARFDTSKSCDSHAIVMRKEMCEALPSAADVCVAQNEVAGRVGCCRTPGGPFLSMRGRQSDGGLGNDCPRLFALTRIHDVVPVFDGQNLLSVQPYLNQCLVLLRKPEPVNFLVLPYEVSVLDPER